jgi:ribonuclease P protein component
MRKDQRLTKTKDFAAVRGKGRAWSDRLLVLLARRNGLGVTRFGFSVGRRVGGAVVRNRVKRRLKETARVAQVRQGWDLVVVARKDASSADFRKLAHSLTRLLDRAEVLHALPKPILSCPEAN